MRKTIKYYWRALTNVDDPELARAQLHIDNAIAGACGVGLVALILWCAL